MPLQNTILSQLNPFKTLIFYFCEFYYIYPKRSFLSGFPKNIFVFPTCPAEFYLIHPKLR